MASFKWKEWTLKVRENFLATFHRNCTLVISSKKKSVHPANPVTPTILDVIARMKLFYANHLIIPGTPMVVKKWALPVLLEIPKGNRGEGGHYNGLYSELFFWQIRVDLWKYIFINLDNKGALRAKEHSYPEIFSQAQPHQSSHWSCGVWRWGGQSFTKWDFPPVPPNGEKIFSPPPPNVQLRFSHFHLWIRWIVFLSSVMVGKTVDCRRHK